VAQYVLAVWQGNLQDPTLSVQIRNGFKPRGILYEHISDPRSFNAAALIVRENPHYTPGAAPQPHHPVPTRRTATHRAILPGLRRPPPAANRPQAHL
jgi:hypothetical protein